MLIVRCQMFELTAFILFIISTGGVCFILYKKMPTLATLPKNGHHGIKIKKHKSWLKLEQRWKEFYFSYFKKQVWLHKFLSRCKILLLKIERNVDVLLHGMRKNAQELDKEVKKKK